MIRKALLVVCFSLLFLGNIWAQTDSIAPTLNDSTLIVYLRTNYYPSSPKNYDTARDSMYATLEVDETDSVTCVYSGLRAMADGTRTPDFELIADGDTTTLSFNTEHSWPQSFYDNAEPMRGDIHHLFPSWSSPNQSRSNHPFGEVDDNTTTSWWYWKNGGSVASIPSSDINSYSEYANSVFEPREDHKGNVARAMFYFWTLYETNSDVVNDTQDNDAFFEGMKSTLYDWHQQDPVDAAEVSRSLAVEGVQGNRNPFIHDTTLVRRAYFYTGSASSDTISDIIISEVYEANGGTVKYVELFNTSDSDINLSTGDWALLRFTNASTSVSSTISLTGSILAKDFYVIGDDNSSNGVQTVLGDSLVNQNTSSVNHNGNDKYLLVKNATTTPDTIDSFGKDNIDDSSDFSSNQVAYRVFSALPNDGSFGQTSKATSGNTTSNGYWKVFDISSSNANATLVATPGYSMGIESSKNPEALIQGSAGWRLISIPGNASTLNELSDDIATQGIGDASDPNVYTYNSNGSYQTPSTLSTTLTNGEGLAVYFFDNLTAGSTKLPISLDLSGSEPSSDVSVTLNTTTLESSSYFTLVGNPFQSNFDANTITSVNTLQANIHVLNSGLYSTVARSSTILKPWQGFWVEAPSVNSATSITFPTSGKTESNATIANYSKRLEELPFVQFNLTSNKTYDKGCRITFKPNANQSWDIYDATKLQPTINEYAVLACTDNGINKSVHSVSTDFADLLTTELSIQSINVEDRLELSWEYSENFPYEIHLVDEYEKLSFKIEQYETYEFYEESQKIKTDQSLATRLQSGPLKLKNVHNRFTVKIIAPNLTSNERKSDLPSSISLNQNYPNPFNPTTTISYNISAASNIKLVVYSMTGKEVAVLKDGFETAGSKELSWDAQGLASGIYYLRLISGSTIETIRMILLK